MVATVRRLITAGALLVLSVIETLLALLAPGFWFSFYPAVSRGMISALGAVSGIFPFSIWDILAVLLFVFLVVWLIVSIRKRRVVRYLALFAEIAAILVFLFLTVWGLNHFAPDAAERLGPDVKEYSEAELTQATRHYTALAGEYAEKIERDGDGTPVIPSFAELSRKAVAGQRAMEQPLFDGGARRVKKLTSSRLYSFMGITGIFVPFTGEACVNTDDYGLSIPFTMCHELSHSCTVAGEDRANYCGFLICEAQDDDLFRYSGYYEAFLYCYNALYERNPAAASKIWSESSALLRADCAAQGVHYEQYSAPAVQHAADKINDTYLKTFAEKSGTASYGECVDYLIAHYLEQNG